MPQLLAGERLGKGWKQCNGFNQGMQGHEGLQMDAPRVTKLTGEACKRRAFYSNALGMCFKMTQTQSPRQGAALCVSTGSLSPFQPRPAVWGRLCQALAEAQEELQKCARYQAVPLALIAVPEFPVDAQGQGITESKNLKALERTSIIIQS